MPPGTVLVDGLPATISSWSDFEISIAIPMYATHGLVIVTTSDQRQSNGRIFEITNEVPISQLPLKPVAGSITLDYGTYPPWSKKFPHSGCDYSSPQGSDVLSVGRGVVYKTKVDSLGFGSIDPLGRGPYIYIKYELSNGDPIYVLYGHTASSWVDMSTGIDTTKFWFSCSYSIELSEGQMIQRGDIVGHSAPFYNGGSAAPHLHLGVFKPKKDKKGIFYEPPFNNLGYSKLSLPTGDWIDPKIFFADYYLK
jgi:murein DD-endopeptidase MepM/ murein hydrolase activator NlpD